LSSRISKEECMTDLMATLWTRQLDTDIEFSCRDGKISAHKAFIKMLCPILGSLIPPYEALPGGGPNTIVLVPNFSLKIVQNFLQMLYTGSTGNLTRMSENLYKSKMFDFLKSHKLDFMLSTDLKFLVVMVYFRVRQLC
jgi:hypothetical protein